MTHSTLKEEEEKLRKNPLIEKLLAAIHRRTGLEGNSKIILKLELTHSNSPHGVLESRTVGNYNYQRQLKGNSRVAYWYVGRRSNGKYVYTYLGKDAPTFVPEDDIAEANRRRLKRASKKTQI